jgi:hypothetical protein
MDFVELEKKLLCPFYRTSQKLWEKGNIKSKQPEMFFCSFGTPVHIDNVADHLKNIEGDAHWNNKSKQMASKGNIKNIEYVGQRAAKKIVILEHEEKTKVNKNTNEEISPLDGFPLVFLNEQGCAICDYCRSNDEHNILHPEGSIEVVTCS